MNDMHATKLFREFFDSERASGIIIILCTILSLSLANSEIGDVYQSLWKTPLLGKSLDYWINEALMAIFFLMIGLEIERELYIGELSSWKNASLPVAAAIGGILMPAGIHLVLNTGTASQAGFGIPMATDIAFSLAVLSLFGNRVSFGLKIFLTALAIIDDLGAIITIAVFYSKGFSLTHFTWALLITLALVIANRLRVMSLALYLCLGAALWYCVLRSGIHATIAGVILAFTIPFGKGQASTPSTVLLHGLHKPVAFVIMPLFALANTSIALPDGWTALLSSTNSMGIIIGLVLGKPLGILAMSYAATATGIARLPKDIRWFQLAGIGLLAGIGFTMSIFISLLAYPNNPSLIVGSKISVLSASLVCAVSAAWVLHLSLPKVAADEQEA